MKKLILALIATAALAMPAQADSLHYFTDGGELKTHCNDIDGKSGDLNWGQCLGFVVGVVDTMSDSCTLDKRVKSGQVRDTVKKYLNDHPERLHEPASDLTVDAIRAAFCK